MLYINKSLYKYIYWLVFIVLTIIFLRFSGFNRNEKFLNLIAQNYFDKEYYLQHYPEIRDQHIDPFNHYIKYGWKEGKNPSKNFDTNFYINMYLLKNKYNLNPLADYIKAKIAFKERLTHPFSQLKKVDLLKNPKYYLSLVVMFRNEARFLKEWIEFYRLIGVKHFYLYNHLSTDNYMEILEPYIKEGIVDLKDIKQEPEDPGQWNKLQTLTYSKLAHEVKDITEWLIVVDTDEFLFPVLQNDLKKVLRNYDKYASVSVNWIIFGSNKVERIMPNQLLIENLTRRNEAPDLHVKTIVKPRYVESFDNPHFAILKEGYAQVTENFEYFYGPFSPTVSFNKLRINHYWARDLEFFRTNKLQRVHIMAKNLNDEEKKAKIENLIKSNEEMSVKLDTSIFKFVKDLQNRMLYSN